MPRILCEKCQRPKSVCLCPYLVSLDAPCKLLILQHPSEQKQALATVPIIQQCVTPCDVWVGEDFSHHPDLDSLLQQDSGIRVLFPSPQAEPWHFQQTLGQAPDVAISTLIVLDGTWNKAKKIWHLNPWLHGLKTVCLSEFPASEYRIRHTSMTESLSTLEAVMHSCNWLSGSNAYDALAVPFRAMIDMQIEKMGEETFFAHYMKSDDGQ